MFYDYFDTGLIGTLTLVAGEAGLGYIFFPKGRNTLPPAADWEQRPKFFKEAKRQLSAYFKGDLKRFDLALAPRGTAFQHKVWDALTRIPYGDVVSYKSIAEAIGNPNAVRAVGGANAKNPLPIVVPCHRVIGSSGNLTGFGGGLDTKARLIDLEKRHRG